MDIASTGLMEELREFVYHEADLLDKQRFDEWKALFTGDGFYWMPLEREQPDPVHHTSLIYDDAALMELRIERMKDPRAYSLIPAVYCNHLLSRPKIDTVDTEAQRFEVQANFLYTEVRGDVLHRLSGTSYYSLCREGDALKMRRKKVTIINCESPLPPLQLYV